MLPIPVGCPLSAISDQVADAAEWTNNFPRFRACGRLCGLPNFQPWQVFCSVAIDHDGVELELWMANWRSCI